MSTNQLLPVSSNQVLLLAGYWAILHILSPKNWLCLFYFMVYLFVKWSCIELVKDVFCSGIIIKIDCRLYRWTFAHCPKSLYSCYMGWQSLFVVPFGFLSRTLSLSLYGSSSSSVALTLYAFRFFPITNNLVITNCGNHFKNGEILKWGYILSAACI